MIRAETVSVRVPVGEQPSLKHLVWARFDTGWHVSGIEGQLFNVSKIIYRVSVEHKLAHGYQRELFVWPDLRVRILSVNNISA